MRGIVVVGGGGKNVIKMPFMWHFIKSRWYLRLIYNKHGVTVQDTGIFLGSVVNGFKQNEWWYRLVPIDSAVNHHFLGSVAPKTALVFR